jgi:DNA-binding transcriptional LysR family regulator
VLVSSLGTGHAHKLAETAIEERVPDGNIICRVPIFTAAAVVAKNSDTIATLPHSIAMALAEDFGLEIIAPPVKLPKIEISQYWHERFHREPGNQWIRSVFLKLFSKRVEKK